MQQSRDSQRQMESRLERLEHTSASMKSLVALSAGSGLSADLLKPMFENLPSAFRAPSMLRVHLQSPWLTMGRSGAAQQSLWQRSLDFGGDRSGRLELYYVDPTGSLGGGLDAEERALAEAFAEVLQAVGRRTSG